MKASQTLKIGAVVLATCGPAMAAGGTFTDIDLNGDDILDLNEFTAAGGTQSSFAGFDLDGDGLVSRAEVAEARGEDPANFDELDQDRDGLIEKGEFAYHFGPEAQQALQKFDENGDGVVTLNEVRRSDDPKGQRSRPQQLRIAEAEATDGTTLRRAPGRSGEVSRRGGGNQDRDRGGNRGGGNGKGGGNGNGKNKR